MNMLLLQNVRRIGSSKRLSYIWIFSIFGMLLIGIRLRRTYDVTPSENGVTEAKPSLISHKLPLHEAARIGDIALLKKLLEDPSNVSNINQEDKIGITPLIEACIAGHLDIVKALIEEYGCLAQPPPPFRHTPLRGATVAGQAHLIPYLLEKGADPNALSEGNRTPLMGACFLRKDVNGGMDHDKISLEAVQYLLNDERTDPTIRNDFGESALDLAKIRGYGDSILLLEKALESWNEKMTSV